MRAHSANSLIGKGASSLEFGDNSIITSFHTASVCWENCMDSWAVKGTKKVEFVNKLLDCSHGNEYIQIPLASAHRTHDNSYATWRYYANMHLLQTADMWIQVLCPKTT